LTGCPGQVKAARLMIEARQNQAGSTVRRGQIELALAMAIVGSSVVIGKVAIATMPVYLTGTLRFAIALALLVGWALIKGHRFPAIRLRDWCVLVVEAATGVLLFNVLLLEGLTRTGAAESGIITSTLPAAIALLSWLLIKDRPTARGVASVVLAIAGVVVLRSASPSTTSVARSGDAMIGNLMVFGAVLCEAMYVLLGRIVAARVSPLDFALVMNGLGFVMFVPLGVRDAFSIDLSTVAPSSWFAVFYYGTFVSIVAFVLSYRAVARIPASTTAVYTAVLPITALLLSYVVLDEKPTWAHAAGLACVLIAILLCTRTANRRIADGAGTEKKL
jgi:drug/metabolite transporter (DMT)-like permease